jgi:DNA-binding SARP family transcriptional activator
MALGLRLLGETYVSLNGNPLRNLNADKALALLFYLVVESDRAHRRESLAEILWPEKPEGFGRNSLKQALSQLRTALGDQGNPNPFLLTSKRDLQFNTDSPHQVDALEVIKIQRQVRSHPHTNLAACEECITSLARIERLYLGEFLENCSLPDCPEFNEWVLAQRESYRRTLVDSLKTLIEHFSQKRDFDTASRYGERLVEIEPWSEQNHRVLMRVKANQGLRSAALKQYHICQEMLSSEFGVTPAPETEALYQQVKDWGGNQGSTAPLLIGEEVYETSQSFQPRLSRLRNWVVFTASISILVLAGLIYTIIGNRNPSSQSASSSAEEVEKKSEPATVIENPALGSESEAGPDLNYDNPFPIGHNLSCLPGEELLYVEDFQNEDLEEWPELYYRAQGWEIVPDPLSLENLAVHHTGNQDAGTDLQDVSYEDYVYRIWIMRSGTGTAFLRWNNSTPEEPGEVEFNSYQMEISYQEYNLAGHAMYRVEFPVNHVTTANIQIMIPENTWVLYEVVQYQDQTLIRVDNEQIISYRDPYPLPPGMVGFEIFQTEDPNFQIYFDNVSICKISDPDG